jgi:tripartite-type tricarboxylate transporter receptor subunit TctC
VKILISLFLLLLSSIALANTTIIVPFSAGGAIDKMAREFSFFVKSKTGENFVVENRVGAGSVVGTQSLLNSSRPDNTLLVTSSSFFNNIVEDRFKKDDFQLVAVLGLNPYVLVTSNLKNLSCNDIKDKNKKFFVGTAGKGSASDIAAEQLLNHYENFTIVHYKGISHVLVDLIPGRVDFSFTSGIKDKDTVKLIASTTTSEFYKGIPSWRSCLGINLNYYNEYLVVVHSTASEEFAKKINSLALEFVKNQETIDKFNQDGIQPVVYNLKDANEYYSTSIATWKKLLKKN